MEHCSVTMVIILKNMMEANKNVPLFSHCIESSLPNLPPRGAFYCKLLLNTKKSGLFLLLTLRIHKNASIKKKTQLKAAQKRCSICSGLLHTGTASLKTNTSAGPRKRMTDNNKP